jgi:rod shape-determining protein MreD
MGDYRPKIEQRVMRQLGRMLLLLLVALFQTALAPSLWSFRVDWVLVVVICWTLLRGLGPGMRWALYGGLALDFMSPLPVGSHLFALLLAVSAVAVMTDALPHDNPFVVTSSVLLVSLLYGAALGMIMSAVGRPVAWQRYPLTIMLPEALANGAATLPAYALLQRFTRTREQPIEFEL